MSSQGTSEMSTAEAHAENAELKCAQSRRKNLTDSLEQKIRCLEKQRKELLEVNQQWDQHFRSMKELYERKVVDLKTKLAATEVRRTLEKERMRSLMEGDRQQTTQEEKERESLNEELQELKKENKLLKERNALTNKKKEHYECEIKRLNKALQDALKIESSSFSEDSRRCQGACNAAEMRTELEVLKQQLQIYEEDFQKERSDRERLNQEKEELQKINQTSQSLLDRLNSQIRACQLEKEELGKQLKQMGLPTCTCGLVFHLRDPWVQTGHGPMPHSPQHSPDSQWHALKQLPLCGQPKAHGFSSEKKANQ
ncbi:TNFAIP3-interacting protein 3 [Nannospalax galili]|uniref:TNFAIP3-interacting protein 3 n=1 Tax=Nannospalax galili TaxID=1026970 RepID=UPI00111BD424|nr:TNFAIP3-interacting protein 3 [Nannospalax galili]